MRLKVPARVLKHDEMLFIVKTVVSSAVLTMASLSKTIAQIIAVVVLISTLILFSNSLSALADEASSNQAVLQQNQMRLEFTLQPGNQSTATTSINDMLTALPPNEELKCNGAGTKCESEFAFPCPQGWKPCKLEGENKTCCAKATNLNPGVDMVITLPNQLN